MLSAERRKQIVTDHRRHDKDSGSPEVQVAMLTRKILELNGHLEDHKKDNHSRRGLILMVGQRNRLLKYLSKSEPGRYTDLIAKLGLRK